MFEKVVKKFSAFVAGVVVYVIAGGLYLGAKGFVTDETGNIMLMSQAHAKTEDATQKIIPQNFGFPQDHVWGDSKAPVALYEYSSFGCFHCADFHLEVLPEIVQNYVEKGLLKVVFVPMPLDKNSMDAALLAECVESDKYFSFAELMFKKQRDWGLAFNPQKVLLQYAALSGVDNDKAEACLHNDVTAARILKDRKDGIDVLKISGTPSFFIASEKGVEIVEGIKSFDDFALIIDEHLADLKSAEK